jgi:DNA-binding FadR family transcriptional regulator
MELKSLKDQNLYQAAQERIKEYIVASGMKEGDPLPTEMELAEKLNISRTIVREALKGLEALQIIGVKHGVGRFLKSFNLEAILQNLSYSIEMNMKDFREILEVRICLEEAFLARETPRFSETDLEDLESILRKLEKASQMNNNESELIELHTAFHLRLYQNANNSLLLNLIRIFSTIQKNLTYLKRYRTLDKKAFVEDHRRILEALRKKDSQEARTRLLEHFAEPLHWARQEYGAVDAEGERIH